MDAPSSTESSLFEGFRLDRRAGVLLRRDERGVFAPIAIGSRALDILGVLVERPGDLVSRDEIIEAVWPGRTVEDSNLNVQVAALRRILDDGRAEGSCIQTVPGRGYRFIAPVMKPDEAAGSAIPTVPSNSARPRPGPASSVPIVAPRRRPRALAAMVAAAWVALVIAVSAWWVWPATRSSPTATVPGAPAIVSTTQPLVAPRLSIVVLPFVNLSDDKEQQYFADGVTEDLTTDLSRIAGSFVISRNTAFTYKDKPVNAKHIGRELGVRYVLEGSVRRSGNQVGVNAQLIDAETDAHLWAERFERDTGDLFAVQNEITSRIAVALNLALIGAEAARLTANPDALDYILRGRAANAKPPSREKDAEAIDLFERALALDPNSVEAQSFLAIALASRVLDYMTDSPAADIARTEGLVRQALAASPGSPLAHFAKGEVLRVQNRYDEGILEFETVLAVNRNFIGALFQLGWCKLMTGSIEEVIPLAQQGIRLSPRDPLIGNFYSRIGLVHLLQSRVDEAIVWLEKARSANAVLFFVHAYLASAYALKGETDRAAAELAEARRLRGEGSFSSIARLSRGYYGVPKIRALYEATYFAGLRKAGMPED
jgi:adenylate cyclase